MKRPTARPRPGPVACLVFTRKLPPAPLTAALFRQGFTVVERQFSRTFLELLTELDPEVIVAALDASHEDDLAVLRYIATHSGEHSVLALLDTYDERLAINALDAGAIAVLPVAAAGALVGAQAAAIRRSALGVLETEQPVQVLVGDLAIDMGRRLVTCRGERVDLTKSEFDIVALLARNAGRVLSPVEIVAGMGQIAASSTQAREMVKVHISHLRTKLARTCAENYLVTVRGVGYVVDRRASTGEDVAGNERARATA